MSRPPHCLAVLAALVFLSASNASAQTLQEGPPPQHRLVYRNLMVARLNPLGLLEEARINYRYRLYRSESPALRDNFVSVGLAPALSPAFGRLGVVVELQPLSILQLWGMYEFIGNFGTFRQLQSFPSALSNFSDTELDALDRLPSGDTRRPYSNMGSQLTLGATLQFKVGPVVARSLFRLVRPDMSLREGNRVFYDIYYDVLAPNQGWYFVNDADVLYQTGRGLTIGLRWASSHAFYGPSHFSPSEPQENLNTAHRVGPVVAYTFAERDGAPFNSPTVLLMVNWWLVHRYRTGADASPFFPYLALGFSFSGDLMPVPSPSER
ncbi:MAG TPA: hypothetical protein VFZ09_44230 [Archangium sp.]|uniref:hypothetical protein n=1 Tax=Archangium sp. TaxID=1872627 RepID=UPI002E33DBD6|nr:hypothetical protein [Archangium sp.]HEX5753290.1 hypothetical protein [Archangium sp.]